jgi:hypothetical protein
MHFGELVDRLQLSLFSISFLDYPKLSLIIYIRKYHNGLPFGHSAATNNTNLLLRRLVETQSHGSGGSDQKGANTVEGKAFKSNCCPEGGALEDLIDTCFAPPNCFGAIRQSIALGLVLLGWSGLSKCIGPTGHRFDRAQQVSCHTFVMQSCISREPFF